MFIYPTIFIIVFVQFRITISPDWVDLECFKITAPFLFLGSTDKKFYLNFDNIVWEATWPALRDFLFVFFFPRVTKSLMQVLLKKKKRRNGCIFPSPRAIGLPSIMAFLPPFLTFAASLSSRKEWSARSQLGHDTVPWVNGLATIRSI